MKKTRYLKNGKKDTLKQSHNMKLTDIILKEGVEKRMINFLDDLNHNKRTIDVADFMKEFGLNRDEAVDFIHKWNMSKVDRSVKEESHGDNYEKNNNFNTADKEVCQPRQYSIILLLENGC